MSHIVEVKALITFTVPTPKALTPLDAVLTASSVARGMYDKIELVNLEPKEEKLIS